MPVRRILSLWFPRLAAERALRRRPPALPVPLVVVEDRMGAQVLSSVSAEARAAGLSTGQPLRDATAMCPGLITVPADPVGEAQFLQALRRWAGKFSPWVAEEAADGLVIDLTGCAHLFGGEAGLLAEVRTDCADLGLTVRAGLADTRGAAWALARFAGQAAAPVRSGDAIEQEARATRARAAKRRNWERGGPAPELPAVQPGTAGAAGPDVIAPPGGAHRALAHLPVAALRLSPETVEGLMRLGLRRVADIAGLPRGALARRFGTEVLRRLDQAFGVEAEPVAPAAAPMHFAVRLSFPDPIGLPEDLAAAVDRLLPALCARLKARGRGARRVRLQGFRSDGGISGIEVGLARAADAEARIRPLLALKLDQIDAGFGLDRIRLEAVETEPLHAVQHRGHVDATADAEARTAGDTALDDLIGKLGARLGPEAVTRLHPAESHVPEKAALTLAAAWSAPHDAPWPEAAAPRPLVLFRPEALGEVAADPMPPAAFRWRGQRHEIRVAIGPERIGPEWWLDDPDWRSGPRDYWRVEVAGGRRVWLYFAHGADLSPGWFAHGVFA